MKTKKESMETEEESIEAQVISLLSGKGGSGKTSAALSIAYLLNDAGFKVLLIDFDFATNGASYFYKFLYPYQKEVTGLYELIEQYLNVHTSLSDAEIKANVLSVKEGLGFIPSRVHFSKKVPLRDSITIKEEDLKSLLLSVIEPCRKQFHFIIIDNQAGSNLSAKVSASVSDKVIIVSGLDPISNDAVDTLLIQIGEVFPEYKRHLINKLDIHETEEYKELSELFQTMNRLPPLPFDFEVRTAFTSRRIPIDVDKPSTFLIALFNTVKAFLPEYNEKIDNYGEKILSKFSQYQDKMDSLLDRKKKQEEEIAHIRKKREKLAFRVRITVPVMVTILAALLSIVMFMGFYRETYVFVGLIIAMISLLYIVVSTQEFREKVEDVERKEMIEMELSEINKEIDRYRSLMLTRSKEWLLHFQKPSSDYVGQS